MYVEQLQRSARDQVIATMNRIKAGTPLTPQNVAVGDYAMTNTFMYGRQAQDEREYMHYRGWSYASIRPLAVTIAGQPVRVARKTTGRRPSPKRTYKALQLGSKMPTWLKQANPQSLDIYEDHPILDVFDQPNDIMGKWHLLYITVASLQLTGRQHWWLTVDKKEKRPVIWPIPSSWIQPIHTKEKAFDHWQLMPGGTGEPVDIPKDEIVYFYYPDPANPLGVVAPLAACSRMVVADDAIWEAQSRSFRQGIWPGLAVIAGEYVDEEGEDGGRPLLERDQRQQIYNAIRRSWGGVMNMNEPLILDALIKDVKKVTSTPAEMDFMQSSKMTKAAIQQTFGTNPSVNGEIEGLNRATAVSARYSFADFTVNPLIQMISETLTFSIGVALAEDEDEKMFVWIEPYHPDEQGERRANFQTASTIGAKIRQNEARTLLCNLPPLEDDEGGEEFCQAAQKPGGGPPKGAEDAAEAGVPFQPAEQNQDTQVTSDGDAADSASDMSADAGDDKRLRITHQKANGKVTPKAPSRIRQNSIERRERRKRRKAVYLKAHARHEDKLIKSIKRLFHEQAVSCMTKLSEIKKPDAMTARHLVDAIYDPAAWTKRLKATVMPELHKAMLKGGMSEWALAMTRHHVTAKAAEVDDILVDLPPNIKHAVNAALEELIDADFWDDVSDDTKEELVESLAEGIENHESLYELCTRIGDNPTTDIGLENPGIFEPGETFGHNPVLGDGPSTARARLIARTETTGAMNAGHLAAIDSLIQDGIATGKSWSAIEDEHTRDAHADADDEYGRDNPIPSDQPFILHDEKAGDVEAMYPGDMDLPPSQRCNCRCLCQAVFPEDAEDTADEGEDGGQADVDDGSVEVSYEEASTEAIAKVVSESVTKAINGWATKWEEEQHPRDHGKFAPKEGGDDDDKKIGQERQYLGIGKNDKTPTEFSHAAQDAERREDGDAAEKHIAAMQAHYNIAKKLHADGRDDEAKEHIAIAKQHSDKADELRDKEHESWKLTSNPPENDTSKDDAEQRLKELAARPPKTMMELHQNADHAKGLIGKLIAPVTVPGKIAAAALKFVGAQFHTLSGDHKPLWAKAVVGGLLLTVGAELAGVEWTHASEHIETPSATEVIQTALSQQIVKHASGLDFGEGWTSPEKSAVGLTQIGDQEEKAPTDADLPQIMAQAKALWAKMKAEFKVPTDA